MEEEKEKEKQQQNQTKKGSKLLLWGTWPFFPLRLSLCVEETEA